MKNVYLVILNYKMPPHKEFLVNADDPCDALEVLQKSTYYKEKLKGCYTELTIKVIDVNRRFERYLRNEYYEIDDL